MAEPFVSPYPVGGAPPPVQPFTSTTRGFQGAHTDEKKKTPEILAAEKAQDEAAQLKLDAAAKQADAEQKQEQIEAQAAQARETSARLAEAQKQEQQVHFERAQGAASAKAAATQADLEKASKLTTLWEDKSTPAKIFSAVMLGFAEGANRQGGESSAMRIYNQQVAEDRQSKLDRLENAKQAHIRATGDIAGAEQMHKTALERIDNERIARDNILAKEIETMGKKIPRASAKAAEVAANIRGEAAKAQVEQQDKFARDYHSAQASGSTTTVVGEKAGGAPPADLTVFDAAGNPRTARSEPEAKALREQYGSLQAAKEIAGRLKDLNAKRGRLPNLELDAAINTEITNLLEKKKEIYGALTEADIKRTKKQLGTGLFQGAEAAGKAVDAFVTGMEGALQSGVSSKSTAAPSAAPSIAPPVPIARPEKLAKDDAAALLALKKDPGNSQLRGILEAKGIDTSVVKRKK